MIELIPYESKYEKETLARITHFFGYHYTLIEGNVAESNDSESKTILTSWCELHK